MRSRRLGHCPSAHASGLFSPGPPHIGIFKKLTRGNGGGIDSAKAVRVGVIDDHVAYAAPAAEGGFCLYFAPNSRRGPTGSSCIPRGAHPGEVVFSVLPRHRRRTAVRSRRGGGRCHGRNRLSGRCGHPDNAGRRFRLLPAHQGRRPDRELRSRACGRDLPCGLRHERYPNRLRRPVTVPEAGPGTGPEVSPTPSAPSPR
jgi:hypothetical protein